MTKDHADRKFSPSPFGIDHYVENRGVLAGNEDQYSVDVVRFAGHSTTEGALDSKENEINSLPATALVLGLAAAACFLILIVYIVVKVHLCKKQKPKDIKSSTITHDTLKNIPSTVIRSPINSFNKELIADEALPNQQSESDFYRMHSIDFLNRSSEPSLTENTPQARLTAARHLPRY